MKYLVYKDSFEYIYDGRYAFEINHKDGEVMQINPLNLVKKDIPNLLIKEFFKGYEKEAASGLVTILDDSSNYYTINYKAAIENRNTVKKIFINRLTGIPARFESTSYNHGKKEVTELSLSDVMVNAKNIPRVVHGLLLILINIPCCPLKILVFPFTKMPGIHWLEKEPLISI